MQFMAQQMPLTDFSFVNPYMLNPARAGDFGTRLFWLNRQQWKDIAGSPETTIITFDHKIPDKNIGLGVMFFSDSDNFFKRTVVSGTYNYFVQLGTHHFLSFGISPGVVYSHIDFSEVRTDEVDDPILFANLQNSVGFTADAGINYTFKELKFGFSALQITGTKLNFQSSIDGNYLNYQLVQQFNGQLSYAFRFLDDRFVLEPLVIGRSTIGLPLQFDAGVNLAWDDIVLSRIGYRYNSNVYLAIAFNLHEDLTVGCGYEYSLGPFSKYSGSTNEIIVGYRLGKEKTKLALKILRKRIIG